jgi:hypothetical protein
MRHVGIFAETSLYHQFHTHAVQKKTFSSNNKFDEAIETEK